MLQLTNHESYALVLKSDSSEPRDRDTVARVLDIDPINERVTVETLDGKSQITISMTEAIAIEDVSTLSETVNDTPMGSYFFTISFNATMQLADGVDLEGNRFEVDVALLEDIA